MFRGALICCGLGSGACGRMRVPGGSRSLETLLKKTNPAIPGKFPQEPYAGTEYVYKRIPEQKVP